MGTNLITLEIDGLEEKEIKDVSGKTISFKKFIVPKHNSDDFTIEYDVRKIEIINGQKAVSSFKSPINHTVDKNQIDPSQVDISNADSIVIPPDTKIYVKLNSQNQKSFCGKSMLFYEIDLDN